MLQHCKARQYNDQIVCGDCNLAWDVNDPSPPECNKQVNRELNKPKPTYRYKNEEV